MSFEVKEILALPDKEKKRIADLIYESLQNEDDSNIANEPLPEWQKKILDERLKSIEDGTAKFVSQKKVDKEIRKILNDIPKTHKKKLDERLKNIEENPENFLTWEETKKELDNFYAELRNKKTGS